MADDYIPYKISVEAAPSWMYRPFKVVFATETPTGTTSQAVYLDESERVALVTALGGASVLAEQGEPEWEYRISDGEFIHYTRTQSRVARAVQRGLDVRRRIPGVPRIPAGPWETVKENTEALTDGSEDR